MDLEATLQGLSNSASQIVLSYGELVREALQSAQHPLIFAAPTVTTLLTAFNFSNFDQIASEA